MKKNENLEDLDNEEYEEPDEAINFSFIFDLSIITGEDNNDMFSVNCSPSFRSMANTDMKRDNAIDAEQMSVGSALTVSTSEKTAFMQALANDPSMREEIIEMISKMSLDSKNNPLPVPSKTDESHRTPPKVTKPTGGNNG